MIVSPAPERAASLMTVEGGLTLIAVALAFWLPRLGFAWFSRIERFFGRLARKQRLAVVTVGLAAILLRLAILPAAHIPHPFVNDDFSFLLGADTFASGRLTNPTPAMWQHFESMQITMTPTYMSMYFPANGLVLAAGKVLFGHPWFGLLCMMGLMCAGICWMLQVWLPPTWALLGGMLAVLRLGLFSYWINTYTGAGTITALGGALVLGALPRFVKTVRLRYGVLMAIGMVLLATSRPYEGILLCLPVVVFLGHWAFTGRNRPSISVLLRRLTLPVALITGACAWMGYYNYRAFGSPLTPPYKIDRATYAVAPYYVWQSPRPMPVYRHKTMRDFYCKEEFTAFEKVHSLSNFLPVTFIKGLRGVVFFAGAALLPPLMMSRRVLHDRRVRFLLVSLGVLAAGMTIQIFFIPHYVAPFTVVFYALGLQAMRHLWVWRPGGQPVGKAMVRLLVTLCIALGTMRLFAAPLHLATHEWPVGSWAGWWYGPENFGEERAMIESKLENLSGKQLIIVRYSPNHNSLDEWVYNAPDIDNAKVIWAREMDDEDNLELIHYYKDRKVWLVQPDLQPAGLSPYPVPTDIHSASTAKSEKKAQQGG